MTSAGKPAATTPARPSACNPCATRPRVSPRCAAVPYGEPDDANHLLIIGLRCATWRRCARFDLLWEQGVAGSNPAVPIGREAVLKAELGLCDLQQAVLGASG